MTNKVMIKSADGVDGCLIYVHGLNTYVFRVYDGYGKFIDYDILHCDLGVRIEDKDATFYKVGDKYILDHSPETLGL